MADFGIFTKNADIQARCGVNANATAKATAATDIYVLDVEAQINVETHYNWSAAVTAGPLDAAVQGLLVEAGACRCAVNVIQQDTGGFNSLEEATMMIDVLWTRYNSAIKLLRDQENKTFIVEAP